MPGMNLGSLLPLLLVFVGGGGGGGLGGLLGGQGNGIGGIGGLFSSLLGGGGAGNAGNAAQAMTPSLPAIKGMIRDVVPYVGDADGSLHRILRVMDAAEILQDINTPAPVVSAPVSGATDNPLMRGLGLMNALSKNLPATAATQNLGQIQSIFNLVNMVNNMGGLEGVMNALKSFSSINSSFAGASDILSHTHASDISVVPNPVLPTTSSPDLAGMVSKLLSGLDENQKRQLAEMARQLSKA